MAAVLEKSFYERPALDVARQLLGKYLVRQVGGRRQVALITETEAYVGPDDLACHASKGCTDRTRVMFGPAGVWYVYFIYGIHWMLNVVTESEGYPAAVLFRGAGEWSGPARLTKALSIDKRLNGQMADRSSGLWIEDHGHRVHGSRVKRLPRVGIDYAGEWVDKPFRFVLDPAVAERLGL